MPSMFTWHMLYLLCETEAHRYLYNMLYRYTGFSAGINGMFLIVYDSCTKQWYR